MTTVDFEAFVSDLAKAAGDIILPFFRTRVATQDKAIGAAFDPVTEADRAAETVMRRMILDTFPAHGIVGEEFPDHQSDADYVWVLDPIDGTKSFISGLPLWGTLIGLEHHGQPAYGMMSQPFTRERFFGDGGRATWSGHNSHDTPITQHLTTRTCASLGEATLLTTSPLLMSEEEHAFYQRVEREVRLPRFGGDCYAYCMLAAGHVDVVIEAGLKPYDIAPLIPIIEGAGGVVTTWDGGNAAKGGRIIAAGDPRVHEAALTLLTDR
ncbi:histidinol-phosphatase [Lichenihabitans psoromatis]|uniref:histidinol-phosphatase n=1 Tax=Lichenihabitans psoromatis TaxID=2528642 RepID=UPI001038340A|nr:histidinol-phosphatase [Lichenihabitans psoromatis]